ncbi:MAG: HPF/RaiA family ribosome-associated protein [Mycobacteriales bacterium]
MTSASTATVHVHTQGTVSRAEVTYAREKLAAVLRYARDPVLLVRAKLTRQQDPALERPAIAQVNVDLNGRQVRAQVARPTMREAVDEVHDRLRDRLQRAAGDWEAIRGGRPLPEPREWRHGSRPTVRPHFFPRPVDEREIVRHKAFALSRMTVEEAAFDMDMLDYDFHLFTEEGSGTDSVLYRRADGSGLRLSQVDPHPEQIVLGETPYTVSPLRPPALRLEDAVQRLDVSGWPFVFFLDATSGRGCLLYHRYDGHYGLIVPAG